MATESILKEYVVKDPRKWEELKREIETAPTKVAKAEGLSPLERGREKLERFPFR